MSEELFSATYTTIRGNNPTSIYRPKIDSTASQAVNGLWNGLWDAHRGGYNVIKAPTEIYKNILFTHL